MRGTGATQHARMPLVVLFLLICGGCVLSLRESPFGAIRIDLHAIFRVHVTWGWLVLAAAVNLVSILAKAAVWKASLSAVWDAARIRWRAVVTAMFIGFLMNTVLAARVGEVARVAVFRRRLRHQGVDMPFATVAGTVIAEQVALGLALVLFVGALVLVVALPSWVTWGLAALAAATAVTGVALGIAAWSMRIRGRSNAPRRRVVRMIEALIAGQRLFTRPRQATIALGAGMLSWVTQVLAIFLVMDAFGIHAGWGAAALVFVTTTFASLFPLLPANIGVFQGAVSVALVTAYGVPTTVALAFSVALQLVEMLFGLGLGIACLAGEGLSFGKVRSLVLSEQRAKPAS